MAVWALRSFTLLAHCFTDIGHHGDANMASFPRWDLWALRLVGIQAMNTFRGWELNLFVFFFNTGKAVFVWKAWFFRNQVALRIGKSPDVATSHEMI
jgi:hypothetical protein